MSEIALPQAQGSAVDAPRGILAAARRMFERYLNTLSEAQLAAAMFSATGEYSVFLGALPYRDADSERAPSN